jgi:hypothetical protein
MMKTLGISVVCAAYMSKKARSKGDASDQFNFAIDILLLPKPSCAKRCEGRINSLYANEVQVSEEGIALFGERNSSRGWHWPEIP